MKSPGFRPSKSGTGTDVCTSSDNSIIVQGMKEEKHILMAYQEKFGAEHHESIITKKKGKTANKKTLNHACMKPSLNIWY
jgi:hypothetical protein